MVQPQLSVIIPTHNRPHLLPLAVRSALRQTYSDLEVVVVDDASDPPVQLPPNPRVRIIRLDPGRGGAGARNAGTRAARGQYVTYLDDDDVLLPHMAAVSMAALEAAPLGAPTAVLSGLSKVDSHGQVLLTRLPPSHCPRGGHFFLEEPEPGRSPHTKQTLVVEREVVLAIGGWDESFRSRVHSEFFLRLNPACTLIGLPTVTYHLLTHTGTRVSGNPKLRQESFNRLIEKHRAAFEAHPKMFSEFVYRHAITSYEMGQTGAALTHWLWSLQLHPRHAGAIAAYAAIDQIKQSLRRMAAPTSPLPPA